MYNYGVLLNSGTYWAKHPATNWLAAVVSNLLRVTKLTGNSTTKEVRVKTDPAEICETTLPVVPFWVQIKFGYVHHDREVLQIDVLTAGCRRGRYNKYGDDKKLRGYVW
jgi:hypothetical protein